MPEHLTFFGDYSETTEQLHWQLQKLYLLECQDDTLTREQQSELAAYRKAARASLGQLRTLLDRIEQAHGLMPDRKGTGV